MHSEVSYTETGSTIWACTRHTRTTALCLAVAWIVPSMAGCTPNNPAAADNANSTAQRSNEPVMLSITGYNYTNRHIESFSVNGQGGGNIYVSLCTKRAPWGRSGSRLRRWPPILGRRAGHRPWGRGSAAFRRSTRDSELVPG
ncbi:DUF3304 domain-containing protein [Pseudoduganella plicata]|uniref:DUF3304 domain-containing protein n=1 Tax=Pseudoduganella plicata TaxID=321984 RepID=A0ABX5SCB2_9BURK|nr:DUF3304 domain-containing protein [Pseudoduganella plicata]